MFAFKQLFTFFKVHCCIDSVVNNKLYYQCFTIVIYDHKLTLQFAPYFTIVINNPSLGRVSWYNNFIVQATVITILNYDCKTYIVQATIQNTLQANPLFLFLYLTVNRLVESIPAPLATGACTTTHFTAVIVATVVSYSVFHCLSLPPQSNIYRQDWSLLKWSPSLMVGYQPCPQIIDLGGSEWQWPTLKLICIWQQLQP